MKNKIITVIFIIYIFTFLILNFILKDGVYNNDERRYYQEFPEFSISNIISGDLMDELEDYSKDQFPFRSNFRNIKALLNYKIFKFKDNNNIYIDKDKVYKLENTNYNSIDNFFKKIEKIKKDFSENNKVYYAIIPDKNYYLEDGYKIDYDYIYKKASKYNFIDFRKTLNKNNYYNTDTHYKIETLSDTAKLLLESMNQSYTEKDYKYSTYDFNGVLYSQSGLSLKSDKLYLPDISNFNNIYVDYLENKDLHSIYNLDKLESIDKYEVFLDGASSFIEIYNEENKTGKELIIFRDSFASSLTPLLVDNYSKITLIDTRYIHRNNYIELIDFTNQDILFLYSTMLINNSITMK